MSCLLEGFHYDQSRVEWGCHDAIEKAPDLLGFGVAPRFDQLADEPVDGMATQVTARYAANSTAAATRSLHGDQPRLLLGLPAMTTDRTMSS
jgi:hypothetical protein